MRGLRALTIAATLALPLATTLGLPTVAHATRVTGYATGVIATYTETDANGALVFGLDETQLMGEAVLITFAYDTALAPADSDPGPETGRYESTDPGLDWLDLAIEVNGITHDLLGANRRVVVRDTASFPDDFLQIAIESFFEDNSSPTRVRRREFLDFIEFFDEATLDSDILPTSFFTDEIFPTGNSANFRINDADYDTLAGETTYSRYVAFEIDLTQISISPVPEPGSATLLALGLIALAGIRRR